MYDAVAGAADEGKTDSAGDDLADAARADVAVVVEVAGQDRFHVMLLEEVEELAAVFVRNRAALGLVRVAEEEGRVGEGDDAVRLAGGARRE